MMNIQLLFAIVTLTSQVCNSNAFAPLVTFHTSSQTTTRSSTSPSSLHMGLFDGFKKAFANEEYGSPPDAVKATARHILVKTGEEADMLIARFAEGNDTFSSLAKEYSSCPSGSQGGSLGSFSPGTMVPEFDKVIFSPETKIGTLVGPVETKFGYHLIVVDKRTGGGDWY